MENRVVRRMPGLLVAIPFLAALGIAHAQDATWDTNPGSNLWNTNTNWTPQTVPTGTATFGLSNTTSITVSSTASIGTIQFNAGAPVYSFDVTGNLSFTGNGIVNNSSNAPTFFTSGTGTVRFANASTAGNANITVNDGTSSFSGTSTAGNATITINSASLGFNTGSTAGNANITVNNGGQTVFSNTSTAGNATIVVNNGGVTRFALTGSAGNATITTNNGGSTRFSGTSNGGNARFITNAGGAFDISQLASTGTTAGSIEGAGLYSLGSKSLTVGSNNLSTTVSGTIADGGLNGGTGGSLVKVGTGTLVLSGANTYTGGTTISAGTLQLGSGGASGSILGNVIDNSVFAINRSDVFTFGGVISGTGSFQQLGAGTTSLMGANSYSGGTTISAGVLNVSADNNLGAASGGVTFNGGTLQFGSAFNLASARTITLNGGGGTFDTNGFNTSISQGITGIGQLTKTGLGTLTLSGSNTYNGGTTISAGTLQLGNGGPSGSITGNVVDNSAFAVNRSDVFTFADVISGTGSLQQLGTGTTILTAANSYSGGTTISAGTLQLGNGGPSGSITGNVVDNSAFAINRSDVFTFAGVISGTGSFKQLGTGTTILTAANSYSGGTTINTGILQLGNGGSSGSIPGNVVDNSVFAINRSNVFAFGGVISGTGSFQQLGTGTTILTAANSYSGGTTISGGVLRVSADNNLGAPSGGLTFNGGTLQFGSAFNIASTRTISLHGGGGTFDTNGFNTSISRGITGVGPLTKTGLGTLTLSGSNTYSGGTELNRGTLVVDNPQALGLGDVTVNAGILEADPQPINVKGNYTQNAAGTLLLQVAGAGQYDYLNVSGSANLSGTLKLTNLGYTPKVGDQLALVRTGGAINSRFANWINPFTTGPGINTIDLIYSKNAVTLAFLNLITPVPPVPPVITTIDFGSFAGTPNQRAAAGLLDAVQLDPRASNLMDFLSNEPFADLPNDFDKISPESLTAFYEISFSEANIQRLILGNRLEDIRNASGGWGSGTEVTVYLEDKADGKSSKNPVMPPPAREKRWDFWSTSFGDFVHVDSDFNARGYKFTTGGIDLGIDYLLTDRLAFGLMGNYAHTWSDLRPGSIDVDSARGGIYATYFNRCLYINGGIYGGYNSYDSSRRGLQGNANGNSDGAEFSTFVSGGYDFHFGHLTAGPIASLQYTNVYVDGFTEQGSLAPLSIHSDSEESLRSDIGFSASYQWQAGSVKIEPFLRATWEHEFKYSALPITAGFDDISGPSATFLGPAEGHDSAVVDTGLSVSWTPTISTFIGYNGLLGRDRYNSNGVSGGIRIRF